MRGLDTFEEGFSARFAKDRKGALADLDADAVPMLYWTAAAWALEIAISKDDAKVLGEQPAMEAVMARAFELDPDWNEGAIRAFYVSYDGSRSESSGGSAKRAKEQFEKALALSHGHNIGLYVSYAESVCEQAHDKKGFLASLDKALAFKVDEAPEYRLVNIIMQDRARWLKGRVDDLFAD